MPTFIEIQEEIANMLDIPDDQLDDEHKRLMDAYLNELAEQEAGKIDGFAQFIRVQSAHAEACKNEGRRLLERAKSAERRLQSLKNHYTGEMLKRGLKKISGSVYSISLRKSQTVEATDDLSILPEPYLRKKEIIEPDKETIREALKDGLEVPGCKLVEKYSLQIR